MINSQLPEKQEILSNALNQLLINIQPNLISSNRDKFTQNLTGVRRTLTNSDVTLRLPKPEIIKLASEGGADFMTSEQVGELLSGFNIMTM